MELFVKKGKKYLKASPGQIVAAAIDTLYQVGLSSIASDISQRIVDLAAIKSIEVPRLGLSERSAGR